MNALPESAKSPFQPWQALAEHSADWLALFDNRHRCLYLNRALRELPPGNWVGLAAEEFVPLEDRARLHAVFEHVIQTGEPRQFEQVVTKPQERGLRYLEWRVRAVRESARITGAAVNITEVTERRAQRDMLRTQSRILETMREGVALIDSAIGIIRLANPALDRMFGFPPGGLLGLSAESFFRLPMLLRQRDADSLRIDDAVADLGQPVEFECSRSDGTRFVASCVVTPLRMSGVDHWLAVLTDVTERKQLEREIIEIASREQQRIGGDLHDGLGQELTGIALMLRSVADQLQQEGSPLELDVEDITSLVNNAIESTRALARGLSPVSADHGGLAAALQSLAERASERYGIRVTFKGECGGASTRLSENTATHMYRIAQEALTNVVRHSLATDVIIRLGVPSGVFDGLELSIDDNGRGFADRPRDASAGLGLKIMRYRAQMVGGDLKVERSASGGVSVRCIFPLS